VQRSPSTIMKASKNEPPAFAFATIKKTKYSSLIICFKSFFVYSMFKMFAKVLLISSTRNTNCWIIPGGGIEFNEDPEVAAEREVFEEAGVKGFLGRSLGIFEVNLFDHYLN
jgi:8-oxo-dGTP pyrophosphatase MutT (NUDIX family)